MVGWELALHPEVDQVPTAGGKEVWNQRSQKPSREGHPGRGRGSRERCRGGVGWDWEPARGAEGGIGNLPDGLSLAKGAGVGLEFYLRVPWAFSEIDGSAVN